MSNAASLTVGTRFLNKGDMANVAKLGTVTEVPEPGYLHVAYDDGTTNLFMPIALFTGHHVRCVVIDEPATVECPCCGGSGAVAVDAGSYFGPPNDRPCVACNETGRVAASRVA